MLNHSDFASVVQLGVGLHLGAVILQTYGEIGLQPIVRAIQRLEEVAEDRSHPPDEKHAEQLTEISAEYRIYQVKVRNEYNKYFIANSAVGVLLAILLVYLAFRSDTEIGHGMAIMCVAFSLLPAPITLFVLWWDSTTALKPLKVRVDALEKSMIG